MVSIFTRSPPKNPQNITLLRRGVIDGSGGGGGGSLGGGCGGGGSSGGGFRLGVAVHVAFER
jgi:hypothetical protein